MCWGRSWARAGEGRGRRESFDMTSADRSEGVGGPCTLEHLSPHDLIALLLAQEARYAAEMADAGTHCRAGAPAQLEQQHGGKPHRVTR